MIHLGEKIAKLVAASGVKIEGFWTKLFAKALAGKDISSFFNFGGVSSGPAPAASTAAPAKVAAKEEKKKEEKKEAPPPPPKEEEEDMDMGGLFD